MRYFCNTLLLILMCVTLHIHAEEMKVLKFKVQIDQRFLFLNKKATLSIKIKNISPISIHTTIVYLIPPQLKYISSNMEGSYLSGNNNSYALLEWKINIPAQTTRLIKTKIRGVKLSPHVTNNITFYYFGKQKQLSSSLRIQGASVTNVSTYDTIDPCKIKEEITYVCSISNDWVHDAYFVQIRNQIPKNMTFLRAELIFYDKEKNNKIKYRYDTTTHSIYFDPIKILKAREKIRCKIYCLAKKRGTSKNTIHVSLYYDDFCIKNTDEEQTIIK